MRTFEIWTIVALCVAAYAATPTAGAQQRAEDVPPPPRTERLEEGDAPAVPARSAENNLSITEKREQGKVVSTEVKSGNSTYYLKPNTPAGSALPGDAQSNPLRAAQWKVFEFDWNPGSEAKKTAEPTAQVPPPPSPTPTSPTEKK
jgi:hypothetical protein